MNRKTARITIAAEIYSPNLGDGLIYESLRFLFQKAYPRIKVMPLDISGRSGYREGNNRSLPLTLSTMGRLHGGRFYDYLNAFRIWLTYQTRWKKIWRAQLQLTDQLIIGGGKLIMDNHLDFPLKLYLLTNLAQELQIPYHLVAVGVGDRWSPFGLRWMGSVVGGAQTVSVRDEVSQERLMDWFGRQDVFLASDPALWAKECYGDFPRENGDTIGLGVLNLVDFNEHRPKGQKLKEKEWEELWMQIAVELAKAGNKVELFTNGNQLDEALAELVYRKTASTDIHKAPRPRNPQELARRICNYQAVLAARFHASVLSASYDVFSIGLIWDDKVDQFYSSLGGADRVFSLVDNPPQIFVDAILKQKQYWQMERVIIAKEKCKAALERIFL